MVPYPRGSTCHQILEKNRQVIGNTKFYVVQVFSKDILLAILTDKCSSFCIKEKESFLSNKNSVFNCKQDAVCVFLLICFSGF